MVREEILNILDKKLIYAKLKEIKGKNELISKIDLAIDKKIDSTNEKAKRFAEKLNTASINKLSAEQLFVFAADKQLKAKGRRGKSWFSNTGESLSVSFLFKLPDNSPEIPQVTAAAALAVKESFKNFSLKTDIKWPNDILVNEKKICGILSELFFTQNKSAFVIIGCGINLNNSSFNEEIKDLATSYYIEKSQKINKNVFLSNLIFEIESYINKYFSGRRKEVISKWKKALNIIGKRVKLSQNNTIYNVIIKDILDSGEILAELEDGSQKKFQSFNTSFKYSN
ncbi:biotin--[acetyl-CoA-carboxylase] ligase [Halanaerobium sp. Z-7514]|uniref:biotin--[biotin carboxyl-carrier protein] ligase n=1 Tax=Halanaerobium polyolivorans TaxID=2886943 RepID=A0AAW4X236_9FIRM|nr:biotin--[acetyl-CoA-carboxylase] ligase [Halanaerobium polyolivorans]MCC3145843.1 biotin--[acetyl-CoA-carboxylase] ligase [Halanaerobium polyolivorans]